MSDSVWRRLIAFGVVLATAWVIYRSFITAEPERSFRRAARQLIAGNWRQAQELAEMALAADPDCRRASLLCGQASIRLDDEPSAVRCFQRIAGVDDAEGVTALVALARLSIQSGHPHEAEAALRRVLATAPWHVQALERLVFVLEAEGRTWEAVAYLRPLILAGHFAAEHLLMLGSTEGQLLDGGRFWQSWREAAGDDAWRLLPEARLALLRQQTDRAKQLLKRIVDRDPAHAEAQAWLGRVLAEESDAGRLLAWHAALPGAAREHPETWYAIGLWAERSGQQPEAARCYGEALRRHPEHVGANYHLSQVLRRLHLDAEAAFFAARSRRLANLEELFKNARANRALLPRIVDEQVKLGRSWEAAAWCHLALLDDPQSAWARTALKQLRASLTSPPFPPDEGDREGVLPIATISTAGRRARLSLSRWPLPSLADRPRETAPAPIDRLADVAFSDDAATAGLHFRYFNGADPQAGVARMFEFSGGGVAALDYDGDGWPDIYLTQGCRWPPDPSQTEHLDALFRNLGNGRFHEVSAAAGVVERGFGQGATVADVNGDGFADVYVANIGSNTFYLNQGDGTFVDATQSSETAGGDWTSSCVLADFNGDALPDLYLATYLGGPDVFQRRCENRGAVVQCAPSMFPAAADRLLLNLGDGRFQDISERAGILAPDGKGLGVVAADLDGSRRLSIFVSNDTTANFLFLNRTPRGAKQCAFVESGLIAGAALDGQGHAQACMGIAAGDADQDGDLDLFVTNFYQESNTLYAQQPGGTFIDPEQKQP